MNTKNKHSQKTTRKLSLWVLFLCCALLLSSCSGTFENNPILANMEKGQGGIDLSLKDISPTAEDDLPAEDETKEADFDYKTVFQANFDKLKSAITYKYTRKIRYVGTPPEKTTEAQKFLMAENLAVSEYKGVALLVDPNNAAKLNIKEGEGFIHTLGSQNGFPAELDSYDTRSLLYYLTNEITVECSGTEEEQVDGKTYTAFVVEENSHPAKWYFDDNGYLSIRLFLDGDILCAVYYNDLKINEELDKTFFTIEESLEGLSALENGIIDPDEQGGSVTTNSETATAPEESSKTESSSTTSKPPASVTPGGNGTVNQQSSKPAENSKPTPKPDTTTSSPASSGQTTSTPSSQPSGQGNQSSTGTASQPAGPSTINDNSKPAQESSKPSTVDKDPAESNTIDPKTLKNYPRDLFPLIYGYTIYSADDTTVGDMRTIELRGSLLGSIEGAAEYYEDLLSRSVNYNSKQVYDEKTGATYYIVSGKISMWTARFEIAEDHITFEKTMIVRLETYD